ncbi:MAG: hypothetical protein LBV70_03280 [Candidatus Adiutrix sp.]|jgi:hypothetical protein|nr:hypothetical protein [Candidatus Adiutrix sp.]
MTARPEAVPGVHVQNPLVAEVRSFRSGPGARPPRLNVLNVRNDPGPQYDAVIRALQRYFNVRPRRQPTADPRDEASVARHPQGLLQAGARWSQDMFYQFTDNGAATYQLRPDYRIWGGTLDMALNGSGWTTVSAPAAAAPGMAADDSGHYDPANAAQEALARINEILAAHDGSRREAVRVGPPALADNPYFDPAFAAQNAFRKMQADLAGGSPAARAGEVQAGLDRAQSIRDGFFRSGPALDAQNI